MNKKQIVTRSLGRAYRSGRRHIEAVAGVTLEIEKGAAIAIEGPSGAGKSTLLHLIGGLDEPTSGKAIIDGVDIYAISDAERAKIRNRAIGFVFQFYHLLSEFTALENVMMPALMKGGRDVSQARDKAMVLLKTVGLSQRVRHRPGELSGGESQRVAIARALINDPGILLCDEPTGNLDSKTGQAICDLLLEMQASRGATLLIVTHDERISSRFQNRLRMQDGKLV